MAFFTSAGRKNRKLGKTFEMLSKVSIDRLSETPIPEADHLYRFPDAFWECKHEIEEFLDRIPGI